MGITLTYEQKQLLSQNQIQSIALLAMCNMELSSFLNNEYLENPLLDHDGSNDTIGMAEEFGSWYQQNQTFSEGYGDNDQMDTVYRTHVLVEESESLKRYLKEQLDARKYSEKEWNLIDFLIMNLDDSGLYTASVEETAKLAKVSVDTVKRCLEDLKQLEPTGIFAENISECLLRQLEVLEVNETALRDMIQYHLDDITHGRISNITRHLGLSSVQVRKYIAFLKTLNPKPLAGFGSGNNSYIVPDIIFEKRGDTWDITLNDEWISKYSLNDYYMKMISENKDPELQKYFQGKLERARLILSSIERRRKTILSVSKIILDWQSPFFKENRELVPMTMNDIAEKLGIHKSTVSRAVNGKYIRYPGGTVLMKDLFLTTVTKAKEEGITASRIKKLLRELIDSEDKQKPYSDQTLGNLLQEQGISVSRRVITKYREEMGIPGSYQRKSDL